MPTKTSEQIRDSEWEAVQALIAEVDEKEKRHEMGQAYNRWEQAVRAFLQLEHERLVCPDEPSLTDLQCHEICLHSLLASGNVFNIWAKQLRPDQLDVLCVPREAIEASVELLRISLRSWHHGFAQEDLSGVQGKIFGAAS
jgi:hypothetical protein